MKRETDSADAAAAVVSCADTWRRAAQARSERRRLDVDSEPHDPLAGLAECVGALSPRLVDAWEATALIESLGYTDRRVQAEFGFPDTRLAGERIFRMADLRGARPTSGDLRRRGAFRGLRPALAYGAAAVALALTLAPFADVERAGGDFLTFVVAAAGTAISWTVLTRALLSQAARPYLRRGAEFAAVLRTHYDRTVSVSAAASGLIAAAAATLARAPRTDVVPGGHGWTAALPAALTAAGVAVGLLNALLLVEVRRPWSAAWAAAPALLTYLACRYAPGLSPQAWPASAFCAAAVSTLLVRRRLHRFDYAYAVVAERGPIAPVDAAAAGLSALTFGAETR